MATRTPISTTQTVTQGLSHLAQATMTAGLRAIQDVGAELRTAGQRTANGSLTAASSPRSERKCSAWLQRTDRHCSR